MGHGGQLVCTCGYSMETMFGIGMLGCGVFELPLREDKGSGLPIFIKRGPEYDLVKLLLTKKHGVAINYGYGLYQCTKCNKFHNYFHYRIKHDGGEHEPTYICRKCSVELKYLGDESEGEDGAAPIDISKYPCPKCKKHTLMLWGGMMWD